MSFHMILVHVHCTSPHPMDVVTAANYQKQVSCNLYPVSVH